MWELGHVFVMETGRIAQLRKTALEERSLFAAAGGGREPLNAHG